MLRTGTCSLSKGIACPSCVLSTAAATKHATTYRQSDRHFASLTSLLQSADRLNFASKTSATASRSWYQPSSKNLFRNTFRHSVHSVPYFYFSRPDFLPSRSSSSQVDGRLAPQTERYLPPLPDVQILIKDERHERLAKAIDALDADESWVVYQELGTHRAALPRDVLDVITTLQCRKPVKGLSEDSTQNLELVSQTCDRILQLCQERQNCEIGSSDRITTPDQDGLDHVPTAIALRLLYLLVVEEEQQMLQSNSRQPKRRPRLVKCLSELIGNIERDSEPLARRIESSVHGRLISSLSRLGAVDVALREMQKMLEESRNVSGEEDVDEPLDHRPFDQLLSALAEREEVTTPKRANLPSPIDDPLKPNLNHPILQALHLTLAADVAASKGVIHRCLRVLDSSTLAWLLPFEQDKFDSAGSSFNFDERTTLRSRFHPWQTPTEGPAVSSDTIHAFSERVALVLAQRGILQPALHIIDLVSSPRAPSPLELRDDSPSPTEPAIKVPDHDLVNVVLQGLARRMELAITSQMRKSADVHRSLFNDLHLVVKLFTIAVRIGVDNDDRTYEALVRAFTACLPTGVVNLGPSRDKLTPITKQIAERNEKKGSRRILQMYLRRVTTIILSRDPDLARDSLSFPVHATLLGLHMRTRDYSFSKRLYQLIRRRDPHSDLWSSEGDAQSLSRAALHPFSAPDGSSFGWFFVESIHIAPKPYFAVQLYLDWIASGNVLSSRLTSVFVQALLRTGFTSIAQRVLQELQDVRMSVPARLARTFVTSFADAGYPEHAVEMAIALTSESMASQIPPTPGADSSTSSSLLDSSLEIMSIALDRASRVEAAWTQERQRGLFRLFDEFRLGLTHYLLRNVRTELRPRERTGPSDLDHSRNIVTIRHVRQAYNAAMRAHLASIREVAGPSTQADLTDAAQPRFDRSADEVSRHQMKKLFEELQGLHVDPDDDSWTLLLLSHLGPHQAGSSDDVAGQLLSSDQILEAMQVFKQSVQASCAVDGVLSTKPDTLPPGSSHLVRPIRVQADAVAELIYKLAESGKPDFAARVYVIFDMRRPKAQDHGDRYHRIELEEAYLLVLAMLGKTNEIGTKLDELVKRGFPTRVARKLGERFLRDF